MKNTIQLLLLALILTGCNAEQETDERVTAVSETETEAAPMAEDPANYQDINSDEALVETALLAAPEASRAGAKVIGYNMAGEFVTLREGTNEFVCLADDPKQDGFNAACYHKDLEPFMARGRELKAEGKSAQDIFAMREDEVKSNKLSMGKAGSTLHIYYGPEARYNPETGKVAGAQYRYVVYMPYATAESTGLPESPIAPNHPWIMDPGTHRAHIMISPLAGEE
ncbi:hypothetical protein [Neolewinella litorea]|uniref:Uncharacterized protein n=1 Tax=Neolewinella litorea TaxID=2562452 RepID=A0A4S4NC27_9BACT|nr:hypothetical protein [Neolewinella litorea]THH35598.1 hypothetical protein E4021_16040 [Neolewinella litorea]